MATNVLQCGGVVVYQLLCGSDIARTDQFAKQMRNYCYLIVNTLDSTAIAVDAAWDVKGIFDLAAQLGVSIRGCIYTHYHFDHCGGSVPSMMTGGKQLQPLAGAKEMQDSGGEIWAGSGDAETIREQCALTGSINGLADGDSIECGDLVLHILNTPGHTPGSVCVFAAPRCLSPRGDLGKSSLKERQIKADSGLLITGDTLFVGSSGATHFPGGNPAEMLRSLARLSTMDPAVVVCPGHAYSDPFTTIGRERAQNQAMRAGLERVPRPPALPPCVACDSSGINCGPKGFVIGRKVRIRGLTSEAGQPLNGQQGVVQGFVAEKERYAVRLFSSSEVKSVRPDNVENAAAG
eukprot:CAMPEP_0117540056 /NCGR_PEP_ID=MMETSP0784-20121206/43303_1 /TAXON_ID=39447 /ORGANISM="" /LENGTH=348 /DNA_ID=CAMNT_0005336701 /DNA_START=59 /DNA_END=1102 /DNA_ORIENTATION=-